MSDPVFLIREIQLEDNPKIERIIKDIFPEFELPLTGTAFEDKEKMVLQKHEIDKVVKDIKRGHKLYSEKMSIELIFAQATRRDVLQHRESIENITTQ